MTAGLLHRDCSGYASSARPFDWAQGPDGGGIAFFLWWMTRELQIEARQGLEGRAQPVPAGVRSATRGMEPEGGTPESPHTGHKLFFYGTFVLPRKRRKKRKKKKTWLYFRDFTLSPSMNWKGTNLWEGFRPCSMEFRREDRPSFARLVQSWRMVVILGHE